MRFPERSFRGKVQQVRLSATNTNNVITYPVVVAVDNRDQSLLPGMTANAEIEVSRRDDVLRVPNAALRFKPADDDATRRPPARRRRARGGGMADGPAAHRAGAAARCRAAGRVRCRAGSRCASAWPRARRRRRRARAAAASVRRRGGGPRGGGNAAPAAAATRARCASACRSASTSSSPRSAPRSIRRSSARWDSRASRRLVSARRAPLYKLVDGKPQAGDGARRRSATAATPKSPATSREGDEVIVGAERAAQARNERVATPTRRAAAVIETPRLGKVYAPGSEAEVVALRDVDLRDRTRRVRRDHGPVGLRQVDADEPARLPGHADRGSYHCDGVDVATLDAEERARLRLDKIGFVFQGFNLLPRMSALENVAMPLGYANVPRDERLRARARGAGGGRPGRSRAPSAQRAVRRPAAARGDRARADQPAADPARRRAHRRARLARPARRSWRCSSACSDDGPHRGADHPRPRRRRATATASS